MYFDWITWCELDDKNKPGPHQMAVRCSTAFVLAELAFPGLLSCQQFSQYFCPVFGTSSRRLNNLVDHFDRTRGERCAAINHTL